MISVLIPVYNYDVREVTMELHSQLFAEAINFEILLLDDGSEEQFKILNRELTSLVNVEYSEEKRNLGRSKIRNKLAHLSSYDNLIFMDCDSQVLRSNYIKNYLKHLGKSPVI